MVEPQHIRNRDWEEDEQLKEDLKRYVLQNLSRREILDFVSRDYAQSAWSLGTLSRRLAFFNVKYADYNGLFHLIYAPPIEGSLHNPLRI